MLYDTCEIVWQDYIIYRNGVGTNAIFHENTAFKRYHELRMEFPEQQIILALRTWCENSGLDNNIEQIHERNLVIHEGNYSE